MFRRNRRKCRAQSVSFDLLKPGVRSSEPQRYVSALADLWERLAATLPALDQLAADPALRLAEPEALDSLPALQYALHAASEAAHGIDPPAGAASAHAELAAALAYARDVTAEVVEALETDGTRAAQALVWEWRGAIFRVRLARLRLADQAAPDPPAADRDALPSARVAVVALLLIIAGALAVVVGAERDLWPLWALGIALAMGGAVTARGEP